MSFRRVTCLIACALLFAGITHAADAGSSVCNASSPTGSFTGTANSRQAGQLQATLNLTCVNGRYSGSVITPLGTFPVTGVTFDGNALTVTFSANGVAGTIDASVRGTSLNGTFALGNDSGTLALVKTMAPMAPATSTLSLNTTQWHADLMDLAQKLPALHASAFHSISRASFDQEVARLAERLSQLNGDAIYFGLDTIANSIGDAHTYIELPTDDANLPIAFQRFGSDYRVVSATAENNAAVRSRVVAVDGVPIRTARSILLRITPAAETMSLRDSRVEGFLTTGMLLRGAGISKVRSPTVYTLLADDGTVFKDTVAAVAPGSAIDYVWAWRSRPLWHQNPAKSFWFTYLRRARTVYARFHGYDNLAANAASLLQYVRAKQPAKLVIDMRTNGGGDYREGFNDLIRPISAMPAINRSGHLFVLVDRDTYSAAMADAALFRRYTRATLVGQTIGERPNGYQEPRQFILPNSGLYVRYSTKYYTFVKSGPNEVVPDKVILPTWIEFKNGVDPVLDWVLSAPTVPID
jgi:hypothetical protein